MSSEFLVNDKVVCVNDSPQSVCGISEKMLKFDGGSVVEGAVYCVERTYDGENGTQGLILTSPKIFLKDAAGCEIGFNSMRFRRVHPRPDVTSTRRSRERNERDRQSAAPPFRYSDVFETPEKLLGEMTVEELRHRLVDELISGEASLVESLEYALAAARQAGGTAGHKHSSRLKTFHAIMQIAKWLRDCRCD